MANRDPKAIKADIDQARDRLAVTVDELAQRTNPRHIAEKMTSAVREVFHRPAVVATLAGIGMATMVIAIRRVKVRRSATQ